MAGTKRVDQQVTSFQTKITSSAFAGLADSNGLVVLGWFDSSLCGTPVTTAGIWSPGCVMINVAGTSTTTNIFCNSGTTASPAWTALTIS